MQPRRRTGDSSPLFTAHGDASKNISRSLWKVFFCSCEVSCGEMSFIANRITVRMTTRRQAGRVESADLTQHVGQRKTEPPFRFCFLSSFCWIRFCPAAGQRCRTDTHGCIGKSLKMVKRLKWEGLLRPKAPGIAAHSRFHSNKRPPSPHNAIVKRAAFDPGETGPRLSLTAGALWVIWTRPIRGKD